MGPKVKILDALIWMRKKLIIPFQSFGMELAQWREESEDGRTGGVELDRANWRWRDCWAWCWTREKPVKDGGFAGVEGGDGGDQPGRTCLRPQRLHRGGVLRGGGHFSSFGRTSCLSGPTWFCQVGDFKDADGMNIAQEVFIDHEPSTITYEVGFRHNTKQESWQCLLFAKLKNIEYDHVWGGCSTISSWGRTECKTRNHGNVFCLQNIVVSGARSWLELWPNVSWRRLSRRTGLSLIFGQKNNNSQSNCLAGQVWV